MPELDLPFDEATKGLTGFEVLGIEAHYKSTLESMGGTKMLIGTVHAYENRGSKSTSWTAVEQMTVEQLTGYFAEAEPDPDGEQGKESTD